MEIVKKEKKNSEIIKSTILIIISIITIMLVIKELMNNSRKMLIFLVGIEVLLVAFNIASLFFQISIKKIKLIRELIILIYSLIFSYMIQYIRYYTVGIKWYYYLMGFVLIAYAVRLIDAVTSNMTITILINSIIILIYSSVAYYVSIFAQRPFLPWDIAATSTAESVLDSYEIKITAHIAISILICILMVSIIRVIKFNYVKWNLRLLKVCGMLIIGIVFNTYWQETDLMTKLQVSNNMFYINNNYNKQGELVSFYAYTPFLKDNKPEGYSRNELDEELNNNKENYIDDKNNTDLKISEIQPKNIIVIMNESFADLRYLNKTEIQNAMPYIDSLNENTIKGWVYVSVFGGTTPNSEYEFLTGNSLFAYPTNKVPYQAAVGKFKYSLVTTLKNQGYETIAYHPFYNNWNRDNAYPALGFDQVIKETDPLNDLECLGTYPSDESDFEKIEQMYENKTSDKLFIFNVTIQNHGGYSESISENKVQTNYTEDVELENYQERIRATDEAFSKLVEYFSNVDEDTMIVMYGDHLPGLSTDTFAKLLGADSFADLTSEQRSKVFITPMIVWTNYDIESKQVGNMSLNYLSSFVLNWANCETTPYNDYLISLYNKYPVISLNAIYDKDWIYYNNDDTLDNDEINLYKKILYNNMSDKTLDWFYKLKGE